MAVRGFTKQKAPFEIGRAGSAEEVKLARESHSAVFCEIPLFLNLIVVGAAEKLKATGDASNVQAFFATKETPQEGYFLGGAAKGLTSTQVLQALENVPEDRRQRILNDALVHVSSNDEDRQAVETIRTLVEAGADVNALEGKPLQEAARVNRLSNARALSELGADFQKAVDGAKNLKNEANLLKNLETIASKLQSRLA